MRRWKLAGCVLLPAAAFVLVGSLGARAQESPQPSPAPVTDTPASAEPSAPPADPTPAPEQAGPAEPAAPVMTPWPWPFTWLEEAAAEQAAAEAAATAAAAAPAGSTQGTAVAKDKHRSQARHGAAEPIVTAADATTLEGDTLPEDPFVGQGGDAPASEPQAPGHSQPATTTTISSSITVSQSCEYKALEHGLAGTTGATYQVSVQNADCTWSTGQFLMSYTIRGPPSIDVLMQSSGVSVDIEVFVTEAKVNLGIAYAGPDGALTAAAPFFLDPLIRSNQTGDNRVEFSQEALASSGDAVSGSQKLTLTVEGDADRIRILAQNLSADDTVAASGDAGAGNVVEGLAGADASGTGADAQAGQIGDNDVVLDQDARARSGDALAGSQKITVNVTGSVDEITVLADNNSTSAMANSGDAIALNEAIGIGGPVASTDSGTAQAGQIGDNRVDLGQVASAITGDALAGSQVIDIQIGGSVRELGVLASNLSDEAIAQSGDALAANDAVAIGGPSATSLDGTAMASQIGNNDVRVDQLAEAISGLAVAGGQVVKIQVGGVIGHGAVMPLNTSGSADAVSGSAIASNDVGGGAGPQARGTGRSAVQQLGDNTLVLDQENRSASGDAVAGGQITGYVVTGIVEDGEAADTSAMAA